MNFMSMSLMATSSSECVKNGTCELVFAFIDLTGETFAYGISAGVDILINFFLNGVNFFQFEHECVWYL